MPWYYPSIGEYTSLLEAQNFHVCKVELFDRPTPLRGEEGLKNWYRMFTGKFFEGISGKESEHILAEIELKLKNSHFRGYGLPIISLFGW